MTNRFKFLFIFSVHFLVGAVSAQSFNRGRIQQLSYFEVIPYKEIDGLPVVPVTINGKTYNFCFDTGAMFTISDKLYRELNPPLVREERISDSSGEKREMRVIKFPELNIQGITFKNTPGIVLHEGSDYYECIGIDGFIGSNMLRNSVVRIDKQSKHITITNHRRKLLLEKHERQKMYLYGRQSRPYIIVALQKGEKKIREKVLVDTGNMGFFDLYTSRVDYLEKEDIVEILAESEGTFSFGIHGMAAKQKHLLLNISELVIGNFPFNDVIITTFNKVDSRIGAKLLEYGSVVFDFKKKRFYFKPFDNISTDDLSLKPATFGFTVQNNKLVVGIIWDKALKSVINPGDEILSINGIDIQSWDICQLYALDNIPDIDEPYIELKDIKTGAIKRIEYKRFS